MGEGRDVYLSDGQTLLQHRQHQRPCAYKCNAEHLSLIPI